MNSIIRVKFYLNHGLQEHEIYIANTLVVNNSIKYSLTILVPSAISVLSLKIAGADQQQCALYKNGIMYFRDG